MNSVKFTNLLSMACRAGKTISGEFVIEKALLKNSKKIKLIVMANDISDTTREKYLDWSNKYQFKLKEIDLSKEDLAKTIGKSNRAAVAILDLGFSEAIEKIIE